MPASRNCLPGIIQQGERGKTAVCRNGTKNKQRSLQSCDSPLNKFAAGDAFPFVRESILAPASCSGDPAVGPAPCVRCSVRFGGCASAGNSSGRPWGLSMTTCAMRSRLGLAGGIFEQRSVVGERLADVFAQVLSRNRLDEGFVRDAGVHGLAKPGEFVVAVR